MATTQTGITQLKVINELPEAYVIADTDILMVQNDLQTFKMSYGDFKNAIIDNSSIVLNGGGKLSANTTDISQFYPVGSLYINALSDQNPSVLLGFGVWQKIESGRVIVGEGTGVDDNTLSRTFSAGEMGGEYEHQLTIDEMAAHTHQDYGLTTRTIAVGNFANFTTSSSRTTNAVGGDQPHNNKQPYTVVNMWERIS